MCSSPIGMCLSHHQGLTPRCNQDRLPSAWTTSQALCIKAHPRKPTTELGQQRQSVVQLGSLHLCEECVPTIVLLLKLTERQQAQFVLTDLAPPLQTVGIWQPSYSVQALEAAPLMLSIKKAILLNGVCPMLFRFRGETPA